MLFIFLVPIIGLALDALINRIFPRAQFRGADFLPFFFIPSCNLITNQEGRPSFLPYGFLFFFILVIIVTVESAVKNKNISFWRTIHRLWGYLNISSVIWYVGLLFLMLV